MSDVLLHIAVTAPHFVAATVQQQSHTKFAWTTAMRVWTAYAYLCCVRYDTCALVKVRRVCGFVRRNPIFQLLYFVCSAYCCCCCRIMPSVSHASSSPMHFVAATVQQQSYSKFVWTTTYYACVDIAYACVCCVCAMMPGTYARV